MFWFLCIPKLWCSEEFCYPSKWLLFSFVFSFYNLIHHANIFVILSERKLKRLKRLSCWMSGDFLCSHHERNMTVFLKKQIHLKNAVTDEIPSLSQDTFFYSLVYDPTQKTLLADKGEIRVGPRFQADVPEMLQEGQSCSLHLITFIMSFLRS